MQIDSQQSHIYVSADIILNDKTIFEADNYICKIKDVKLPLPSQGEIWLPIIDWLKEEPGIWDKFKLDNKIDTIQGKAIFIGSQVHNHVEDALYKEFVKDILGAIAYQPVKFKKLISACLFSNTFIFVYASFFITFKQD